MTAEVVVYPAHPEDDHNTAKVECKPCGVEFGWCTETPAGLDRLDDLADRHNLDHHGHRRCYL